VQGFVVINIAPWYGFLSILLAAFVIWALAAHPRRAV
jgi:hypothetical protein